MTSISAGHIILIPTQPVGSGRPQQGSNPGPPDQESRALPTELPRPPRSLVYNAVVSGAAETECTLWEWAWLAKKCSRVKCRLKVRAELSCLSTLIDTVSAYQGDVTTFDDIPVCYL